MEIAFKLLLFVTGTAALLAVNLWFGGMMYRSLVSRPFPDTIAPVRLIGAEDPQGKTGQALAAMLLARLGRIREDMNASLEELRAPIPDSGPTAQQVTAAIALELPERMLEPVTIEMKVGGVEVGGLLSWVHDRLSRDDALKLSLESRDGYALVTGVWNDGKGTLWVEVEGDAGSPVPTEKIAAAVAFALTQKQFEVRVPALGALTRVEFEALLETLSAAAVLRRQVELGRIVETEFADLGTRIDVLVAKVPRWFELTLLGARLWDNAGKAERALELYRSAIALAESAGAPTQDLTERVAALTERVALATARIAVNLAAAGGDSDVERSKFSQWPLLAIGVESLEMPRAPRIAVLGGPPTPPFDARYSLVGSAGPDTARADTADYVRTLVDTLEMVAPQARFVFTAAPMPLTGGDAEVLRGLSTLVAANPDVLVVTFGPLQGEVYERVFAAIVEKGIVVVMAAGNRPNEPLPFAGSQLAEKIIVVGSVGPDGTPSWFTQSGDGMFWAPGEEIPIASSTGVRSGTTYAAALAAGVVARVLAEFPAVQREQLIRVLRATATSTDTSKPAVINLAVALRELARAAGQ